jgi:hypothetical protein
MIMSVPSEEPAQYCALGLAHSYVPLTIVTWALARAAEATRTRAAVFMLKRRRVVYKYERYGETVRRWALFSRLREMEMMFTTRVLSQVYLGERSTRVGPSSR